MRRCRASPSLRGTLLPPLEPKKPPTEPSADEVAQKAARNTIAEGESYGPATTVAGEIGVPTRQTSPGTLLISYFPRCFDFFSRFIHLLKIPASSLFTGLFMYSPQAEELELLEVVDDKGSLPRMRPSRLPLQRGRTLLPGTHRALWRWWSALRKMCQQREWSLR